MSFKNSLKALRISPQTSPSPLEYFNQTGCQREIKPIPLLCMKIGHQGDSKFMKKVQLKAYKSFSRVAATGELSICHLDKIKHSSSLKRIRSLEFDPYFCDTSGLSSFVRVLKKVKGSINHLNLIIRRFDHQNEFEELCPFIGRLNRLTKLRIELPNTQRIVPETNKLKKNCKILRSLKSLEVCYVGQNENTKTFYCLFMVMPWLENVYFNVQSSDVVSQKLKNQNYQEPKLTKFRNMKSLSFKFSFRSVWSSYFDGMGSEQGFALFLKSIPTHLNPTYMSFTFEKLPIASTALVEISNMLSKVTNLRFFFLELQNIKLGEFEIMILANGFIKCKQVEHLTFKYLENVPIPLPEIFQFIFVMAKYSHFPKFDLFFRKLFYSEWQTPETKQKLENLENVEYALTKQSLHIQRKWKQIEPQKEFCQLSFGEYQNL